MTPLASVAMLEKLALLKMAFWRAPALSKVSSACLRTTWSAPSRIPSGLVSPFASFKITPPIVYSYSTVRSAGVDLLSNRERTLNGVLQLILRVGLVQELRAFDQQFFHFFSDGVASRVEDAQVRPQRNGL